MNPIQRIRQYLNDRDTRNHLGAKLFLKHEGYAFKINEIIMEAVQILQQSFTKTDKTNSGSCKLTAVSTRIGEMAMHHLNEYDRLTKTGMLWTNLIKVGDLILESFLQNEYIEIFYTHYDFNEKRYCYQVKWGEKWDPTKIPNAYDPYWIRGSVEEKIEELGLFNPKTGLPTIKNVYTYKEFNKLKNKLFMKAGLKLSQTAWKINRRLLNAVLNIKPHIDLTNKSKYTEYDITTRKAKILVDYEKFYQYIDFDYRGRIYYTESFINFQSSDYARGILQFHEGKPLTSDGRWWLAVHTASSFNQSFNIDEIPSWCKGNYYDYLKSEKLESISVDKMILEDRATWTLENMDFILDCAEEDYLCTDDAEKPVSFLACCIEWEGIHSNPDHISHLPIPIDGSNNGWQHLGAISKDTRTGKLVGLTPVEIQADFYVQTAKELISLMPEWFKERLDMKMKHIRKGISKRGSMTRAYSAGAGKIAENMYKDCKTEKYHTKFNITKEDCKKLSINLVKAIKKVCPGPLETMRFLQSIAQEKLKDNTYLTWTTPSEFEVKYVAPILIPMKTKSTLKGLGKNRDQVKHTHRIPKLKKENNETLPDKKKYASGISPNFIHSMDASHMALVINEWDKDFGAIHDSFSTHANDIEDLLELTKKVFINMYDKDNYFKEIEKIFDIKMESKPETGDLNIQEVNESDYFFA